MQGQELCPESQFTEPHISFLLLPSLKLDPDSQTLVTYFRSHDIGFPGGSAGKESICNAGDPGLIPRSGRSPGEGNPDRIPTPVFLPGEFHGQESDELQSMGYSLGGSQKVRRN